MKRVITIIKWWPIVTNLAIIVTFLFSLLGFNTYGTLSPIFGVSLFTSIMWYFLSIGCRFCAWHRVLILNLMFISGIVLMDHTIYLFQSLFYIKLILIMSCVTVCISWIHYKIFGSFQK